MRSFPAHSPGEQRTRKHSRRCLRGPTQQQGIEGRSLRQKASGEELLQEQEEKEKTACRALQRASITTTPLRWGSQKKRNLRVAMLQ